MLGRGYSESAELGVPGGGDLASQAVDDVDTASCTARHTSHVTRHTSHVTRHTSHVTRHTSNVTHHTSHITLRITSVCHKYPHAISRCGDGTRICLLRTKTMDHLKQTFCEPKTRKKNTSQEHLSLKLRRQRLGRGLPQTANAKKTIKHRRYYGVIEEVSEHAQRLRQLGLALVHGDSSRRGRAKHGFRTSRGSGSLFVQGHGWGCAVEGRWALVG